MSQSEKSKIIEELEQHLISHCDVPAELKTDKDIIYSERKSGIRKTDHIGFDVIRQIFVVHESVLINSSLIQNTENWKEEITTFESFFDFYDYLDGEIYTNACFYQCDLSQYSEIVDLTRIPNCISFIDYTIENFTLEPTDTEKSIYEKTKQIKPEIKKWIDRFNSCDSFEKMIDSIDSYHGSSLSTEFKIDLTFFIWQYIYNDIDAKHRFEIVMQCLSSGEFSEYKVLYPLCHIYNPYEILSSYHYSCGTKKTCDNHIRRLKAYINDIDDNAIYEKRVFFDPKTHYYCEATIYDNNPFPFCIHSRRYFETIEDLILHLNGDLTNVDLSKDICLNYDFSDCKIDAESTILPISSYSKLDYYVSKKYANGKFIVLQSWYTQNTLLCKQYKHVFDYFFDFVAFLKGDLSNADLTQCDGLINLTNTNGIIFSGTQITSHICKKLRLDYQKCNLNKYEITSFKETNKAEKETTQILLSSRETEASVIGNNLVSTQDRFSHYEDIYYISDLHILHKIKHHKPISNSDVIHIVQSYVSQIVSEIGNGDILLIGGDVSSEFDIFTLFVEQLRFELDQKQHHSLCVVFVLGNHELWGFANHSFDKIVDKYNKLLIKYNMHLLQNCILFQDNNRSWNSIMMSEIISLSSKDIFARLQKARVMIFGGLAFSGFNSNFNANNGIYRETINREQEISESSLFMQLYDKLVDSIPDRELIVFTHTPINCWNSKPEYHSPYIYVSGHTHRNAFYDDGTTRIYSDNQIGYGNKHMQLKWFTVDRTYDIFSDYSDGIYQISGKQYREFHKGKNIYIDFTRTVNVLYMLKKKGYYCFIHQSQSGSLSILNGGALKALKNQTIQYYYDNMESVIALTKEPLDKYTSLQKKISDEIKRIGGSGYIHGCIIDIDTFNHIYVNPIDHKLTAYWAQDIVFKKAYPSIRALLEAECPALLAKYSALLSANNKELPILSKENKTPSVIRPQIYLDTDIYKASREIKKMQRLDSNILTVWYDVGDKPRLTNSNNYLES